MLNKLIQGSVAAALLAMMMQLVHSQAYVLPYLSLQHQVLNTSFMSLVSVVLMVLTKFL